MIGAVSILSGCIEIIGFIKDRSAKKELLPTNNQIDLSSGPHTNVSGDQENLFSGSFDGPTSAKGEAVDMRESTGSINIAEGPVNQHFGDNITQIIKSSEKQLIPRIQPPPQDFVGRVDDINEILSGFERGAVIAGLRGMGGVGKTALALLLAERLAGDYSDGQILVEMKGTGKNPLSWAEAMIQIIHAYEPEFKMPMNEGELPGKYFSILHGKKALLILDNAASREQVEPLLPPKNCALLVTSRKKFALLGLAEKDLDVMPLEDARKLLLEICGRIGDHASELAEICGRLPIALRNAASILRERPNLSVANYVERLGDAKKRLELVDASFSTSYELLTPELQRLWSMLSVFPADFDLEGAAAVWDIEKTPSEDALGDLIRWSLVDFLPDAQAESGRYKLHDLARDFAESRLEAKSRDVSKQRHAKYYKKILSRVDEIYARGGMNTKTGLELFNLEWTNIKAGQSWAEDMIISKSLRDESILQLACDYPAEGAYAMEVLLNPRERIHWLETALFAARQLKDNKMEGSHLGNLGIAYCQIGEVEKAINIFQQHLSISRKIGDIFGESNSIGNIGAVYSMIGDTSKAIGFFERHLSIARKRGDRRGESNDLGNLGLAYLDLGKSLKAIESFKKSREINRAIGNKQGEDANLGNLGLAYASLGEQSKAIESYEEALKISREIGDRRGEGNHLFNMSLSFLALGQPEKAISFAKSALAIYEQIESPDAETVRKKLVEWGA